MKEWEADLIKWILKHFCPKPPKPKPTLEFQIGPTVQKEYYQ